VHAFVRVDADAPPIAGAPAAPSKGPGLGSASEASGLLSGRS
jgi:hypothetical protein